MILRPSNSVVDSNMVLVIPDPWNAFKPMLFTDDGIVMAVKPVAPWKALAPMLVTDDGMVIDVRLVIPWKALAPMLVTEDGMVMDVTGVAS